MSTTVTIHVADLVDSPHAVARDSSNEQFPDVVAVDFDLRTGMQGTLADMLTVIGRAHEQLHVIARARSLLDDAELTSNITPEVEA